MCPSQGRTDMHASDGSEARFKKLGMFGNLCSLELSEAKQVWLMDSEGFFGPGPNDLSIP